MGTDKPSEDGVSPEGIDESVPADSTYDSNYLANQLEQYAISASDETRLSTLTLLLDAISADFSQSYFEHVHDTQVDSIESDRYQQLIQTYLRTIGDFGTNGHYAAGFDTEHFENRTELVDQLKRNDVSIGEFIQGVLRAQPVIIDELFETLALRLSQMEVEQEMLSEILTEFESLQQLAVSGVKFLNYDLGIVSDLYINRILVDQFNQSISQVPIPAIIVESSPVSILEYNQPMESLVSDKSVAEFLDHAVIQSDSKPLESQPLLKDSLQDITEPSSDVPILYHTCDDQIFVKGNIIPVPISPDKEIIVLFCVEFDGNTEDRNGNIKITSTESVLPSEQPTIGDQLEMVQSKIESTLSNARPSNTSQNPLCRLERYNSEDEIVLESNWSELPDITESLEELQTNVTELDQFVELIERITKQTNILAINARIEAARLPDSGGMEVVADEIKSLADETKAQTTELSDHIELLQHQLDETVQITESSTREYNAIEEFESANCLEENEASNNTAGVNPTEAISVLQNELSRMSDRNKELMAVLEDISSDLSDILNQPDQ